MFKETCILFRDKVTNDKEAIENIGNILVENECIKQTYINSTIERELEFPTAVDFGSICIAIPHATPDNNVLSDCIGVLRLKEPVSFKSMDGTGHLKVKLVFLLALKNGKNHLTVLSKFMTMFQDEKFVKSLLKLEDKNSIVKLLNDKLEI